MNAGTETPCFAVVGHVNKGKSSVVATLAEDDTVAISREPGTTVHCREYPLRVDGRVLFRLVDTPGFEQARRALAWLQARETGVAGRRQVVEQFLAEHAGSAAFPEECELLRPILAGAAILYVVDGSRPYSPEYEAEMEILRWTGQPRMALINSIGPQDHTAEWRAALDQYFSLVRSFHVLRARFEDRVRLLETFGELHEGWRPALQQAIRHLVQERARRVRHAARILADLVGDVLGCTVEKKVSTDADPARYRDELQARYRDELRGLEARARRELEHLYQHRDFEFQSPELELIEEDLFAESTWLRLGLTRRQLATSGAVGGAVLGGTLDAALGGASFLLGSLVGGALGGLTAWLAKDQIAEMKVKGLPLGGKLLRFGPTRNPQLAWIVLDRALLHFELVSRRAHAQRGPVAPGDTDKEGVVGRLEAPERRGLAQCLERLRGKDVLAGEPFRKDLAARLETLLQRSRGTDHPPRC